MPNEENIQKISLVDPIQVNINIPNFEGKQGKDGANGRDGDDAYRVAVRNGFKGTEKEWLLTLKGQSASSPLSRQLLLKNNIWCEDDAPDSILQALINNWGKPMPRTDYKPLSIQTTPKIGNPNLKFSGEPHFKARVDNKTIEFDTNGSASVTVHSANAGDSYEVLYIGYTGNTISTTQCRFGDIGNVFAKGTLIESKEIDLGGGQFVTASVYDNKLLELTSKQGFMIPAVNKTNLDKIKAWVLTKVDDINTIVVDRILCNRAWLEYQYSILEEWGKSIGHGVNVKLDLSLYKERGGANKKLQRLFDYISPTDKRGKYYIDKLIQVNNSNIFLLKDGMSNVSYNWETNTIINNANA